MDGARIPDNSIPVQHNVVTQNEGVAEQQPVVVAKQAIVEPEERRSSVDQNAAGSAGYGGAHEAGNMSRPLPSSNLITLRAPTQQVATILAVIDTDGSGAVDHREAAHFVGSLVAGAPAKDVARLEKMLLSSLLGVHEETTKALLDLARGGDVAQQIEVPDMARRTGGLLASAPWFDAAQMVWISRADAEDKQSTTSKLRDPAGNELEIETGWVRSMVRMRDPQGETKVERELDPETAAELARAVAGAFAKQGVFTANRDAFADLRREISSAFDQAKLAKTPKGFSLPPGVSMAKGIDPRSDLEITGAPPKGLEKLAWMQGAEGGYGFDIKLFRQEGRKDGPIWITYQALDPEQNRFITTEPRPMNKAEAKKIREGLNKSLVGGFWNDAFYKGLQAGSLISVLNHIASKNLPTWEREQSVILETMEQILEVIKRYEMEPDVRLSVVRSMNERYSQDMNMPAATRRAIAEYLAEVEQDAAARA